MTSSSRGHFSVELRDSSPGAARTVRAPPSPLRTMSLSRPSTPRRSESPSRPTFAPSSNESRLQNLVRDIQHTSLQPWRQRISAIVTKVKKCLFMSEEDRLLLQGIRERNTGFLINVETIMREASNKGEGIDGGVLRQTFATWSECIDLNERLAKVLKDYKRALKHKSERGKDSFCRNSFPSSEEAAVQRRKALELSEGMRSGTTTPSNRSERSRSPIVTLQQQQQQHLSSTTNQAQRRSLGSTPTTSPQQRASSSLFPPAVTFQQLAPKFKEIRSKSTERSTAQTGSSRQQSPARSSGSFLGAVISPSSRGDSHGDVSALRSPQPLHEENDVCAKELSALLEELDLMAKRESSFGPSDISRAQGIFARLYGDEEGWSKFRVWLDAVSVRKVRHTGK